MLAIHDRDPGSLKVLKFTTRVPLGIATLYASEIEIKCRGAVYTPAECTSARRTHAAVLLAALGLREQQRDSYQGCCSWHGGIFGCDYDVNRIVCNDGGFSPTCRCPLRDGYVDSLAKLSASECCDFLQGDVIGCDYRVRRIVCANGQYGGCACP